MRIVSLHDKFPQIIYTRLKDVYLKRFILIHKSSSIRILPLCIDNTVSINQVHTSPQNTQPTCFPV